MTRFSTFFIVGLTASTFGLGGTLSNYLGQLVVEKFGHVASLSGSLVLSFVPVLIFGLFMPETLGVRDAPVSHDDDHPTMKHGVVQDGQYVEMAS
jgi:hypothetical protein